jgi:hypothetical protein
LCDGHAAVEAKWPVSEQDDRLEMVALTLTRLGRLGHDVDDLLDVLAEAAERWFRYQFLNVARAVARDRRQQWTHVVKAKRALDTALAALDRLDTDGLDAATAAVIARPYRASRRTIASLDARAAVEQRSLDSWEPGYRDKESAQQAHMTWLKAALIERRVPPSDVVMLQDALFVKRLNTTSPPRV